MPSEQASSADAPDEVLSALTTESVRDSGADLDLLPTAQLVEAMNAEDQSVPIAVAKASAEISRAIDAIAERMMRGGRLFYVGAGTPGRIGILDASELPPTFGVDPSLVVGIIAGGRSAVFEAVENAEDNRLAGQEDLAAHGLNRLDSVVGLSASGRTPYVVGALEFARECGALSIGLSSNANSAVGRVSDIAIEVIVGPELLSGSTRLKSGSAQKSVLNMISTIVMMKLGKTYGNLMIDLRVTNHKLRDRAEHTVMRITGATQEQAREALAATGDSVKEAAVLISSGLDLDGVRQLLAARNGSFREAIAAGRVVAQES